MRSERAADRVAAASPCRIPRDAVFATCISGPTVNTTSTRCAASRSFSMIRRLSGRLVDQLLHLRRPMAGVPLLQLRDLPVRPLDDLPAAVGLAVTHHDEVRVGDDGGVVKGELFADTDVTDRDERRLVPPSEVRVAAVVQ